MLWDQHSEAAEQGIRGEFAANVRRSEQIG